MALKSELVGPDYRIDRAWTALGAAAGVLSAEVVLILAVTAWLYSNAFTGYLFTLVSTPALLFLTLGVMAFVIGGLSWIARLEWARLVCRSTIVRTGETRVLLGALALVVAAFALLALAPVVWVIAVEIAYPGSLASS